MVILVGCFNIYMTFFYAELNLSEERLHNMVKKPVRRLTKREPLNG